MYNCYAGRRVDCIIGSACIRDFSTATEVLQGKAGATGPQLQQFGTGAYGFSELHKSPL